VPADPQADRGLVEPQPFDDPRRLDLGRAIRVYCNCARIAP